MSNLRNRLLLFVTSLFVLLLYLFSVIHTKYEKFIIDERLITEELGHKDYINLQQRSTNPSEDEEPGDILKFFDGEVFRTVESSDVQMPNTCVETKLTVNGQH